FEHSKCGGGRKGHHIVGCAGNELSFGTAAAGEHSVHSSFENERADCDNGNHQEELRAHPWIAQYPPFGPEAEEHSGHQCSKTHRNPEYKSKHLERLIG